MHHAITLSDLQKVDGVRLYLENHRNGQRSSTMYHDDMKHDLCPTENFQPYILSLFHCTQGCKYFNNLRRQHPACHHLWHQTISPGKHYPQWTAQLRLLPIVRQCSLFMIKWCHYTPPKRIWRRSDKKNVGAQQCSKHQHHISKLVTPSITQTRYTKIWWI